MTIKTKLILKDVQECTSLGIKNFLLAQPQPEVIAIKTDDAELSQPGEGTHPVVIVTDISQPLQTGMEAVESLVKKRHPIPVVVFTSAEKVCIINRLLQAGVKGYVSKNCAMEELLYAIETATSGERYLCPVTEGILKNNNISLSGHQRNIIHLIKDGKTDAEIGTALCKSPRSIESQRDIIKRKLKVTNNASMVYKAFADGHLYSLLCMMVWGIQ